jgi:hypothetical protein
MKMKDFARYLKYESFDKALHHIRQISSERTTETELSVKRFGASACPISFPYFI